MAPVHQTLIRPRPLVPGDKIAIVSPAGAVDNSLFEPAIGSLEEQGWKVDVLPHAKGRKGSYSGTISERLSDMKKSLLDPDVRAIMCGRGGFGAVHLLPELDLLPLSHDPKWLIGFSDISALHGLWNAHGLQSIHSPMLRGLDYCARSGDARQCDSLFGILKGQRFGIEWGHNDLDKCGQSSGLLLGGNLSVLDALIGTKYDLLRTDTILFVEDVNEPIYKIERMFWQLRLCNVLPRLRGLICGQFVGSEPDSNYANVYQMIKEMTHEYAYPVSFGAPIGHKGLNMPMLEGAMVDFKVGLNGTSIKEI